LLEQEKRKVDTASQSNIIKRKKQYKQGKGAKGIVSEKREDASASCGEAKGRRQGWVTTEDGTRTGLVQRAGKEKERSKKGQ